MSLWPPGNPQDGRQGPQNGILAIKTATRGDFLRLKTFLRGFAGCPTVWEGSETVADQFWTPLFEKFPKIFGKFFSKKHFWSKNTFYGFPGLKKSVFERTKIDPNFCCRNLGILEPAAPGKPPGRAVGAPKRYFGHKNGYTGAFSVLKNFLPGFCRVPDHFGGFRDGRRPVVGPFRLAMQGGGRRRALHYLNSGIYLATHWSLTRSR